MRSRVLGVIYIDSTAPEFFITDEALGQVVAMAGSFLDALARAVRLPVDRVRNIPLVELTGKANSQDGLEEGLGDTLELVKAVNPPKVDIPLQLNFDYSDFIPIHAVSAK